MDFPSHFIWAYVLFRHEPWLWVGVAFCIVPDVLWFVPMAGRRYALRHEITFRDVQSYYRASHSLVTVAAAYAVALAFFGSGTAFAVAAGWLLHFFMDVWTHKGGIVQGIAPLYPLSNWRSPALFWWSEQIQRRPWLYAANLAAAAAAYLLTA